MEKYYHDYYININYVTWRLKDEGDRKENDIGIVKNGENKAAT